MQKKIESTGEEINGQVVLRITDDSSDFNGVEYYYESMKFADEENSDGSINMSFEYNITKGSVKDEVAFGQYIGQILYTVLEEQIERNEAVYIGGKD